MMKHGVAAFLLLAIAGTGAAKADEECHVAMDQWQPREAVQTMAASRGWTVTRIKIDDGCYQLRGIDETGRAFTVKIDPATLEILQFRHKDRDDEQHGSMREGRRKMETGAASGGPTEPLFGSNARPMIAAQE